MNPVCMPFAKPPIFPQTLPQKLAPILAQWAAWWRACGQRIGLGQLGEVRQQRPEVALEDGGRPRELDADLLPKTNLIEATKLCHSVNGHPGIERTTWFLRSHFHINLPRN